MALAGVFVVMGPEGWPVVAGWLAGGSWLANGVGSRQLGLATGAAGLYTLPDRMTSVHVSVA